MKHDCSHCDGHWMTSDTGMKRCTFCARGEELRAADRARRGAAVKVAPAISQEVATAVVAALGAIPYFPSDATIRGVIGEEVRAICGTPAEAAWLADRMIFLYARWPGPRDLRIVYASRKVPHDGILPIGTSEAYPDGIPPEREPEPAMLMLPPGAPVSAAPELVAAVGKLADAKDIMCRPAKPSPRLVTQADMEAAMEANRNRREARTQKEPA